ncbi:MAG: hypothetical protein P4L10_14740 [Acidobacteriaceae bacterium]|nr:hypothetical protein [Acidobacteriaceae bacterium]
MQFEVGDISVEFFGKLLEEFCEMLVGYRELYCLRDVRPLKKIHEEFRAPKAAIAPREEGDASVKRMMRPTESGELQRASTLSPKLLQDMEGLMLSSPGKPRVAKIFTHIDEYFAEHSARIMVGFGTVSVALYENAVEAGKVLVRSAPFAQLTLPASIVSMHKDGDRLNANVLGITFVSTKSASFASQFWTVRFPSVESS